jgi:hypothetical protein
MSKLSQPQPQKRADMEQVSKGLIWMKTEYDVKKEANFMKEKLHAVRENYRRANYAEIKRNNKSFIEWNEDLLSFCKANRVSVLAANSSFLFLINEMSQASKITQTCRLDWYCIEYMSVLVIN